MKNNQCEQMVDIVTNEDNFGVDGFTKYIAEHGQELSKEQLQMIIISLDLNLFKYLVDNNKLESYDGIMIDTVMDIDEHNFNDSNIN